MASQTNRPPAHSCYNSSLAVLLPPGPPLSLAGSCKFLFHLSPSPFSHLPFTTTTFFPPSLTPSFMPASGLTGSQDKNRRFQMRKSDVQRMDYPICKGYPKNPTSIVVLKLGTFSSHNYTGSHAGNPPSPYSTTSPNNTCMPDPLAGSASGFSRPLGLGSYGKSTS